jgi:hypothetical protein
MILAAGSIWQHLVRLHDAPRPASARRARRPLADACLLLPVRHHDASRVMSRWCGLHRWEDVMDVIFMASTSSSSNGPPYQQRNQTEE